VTQDRLFILPSSLYLKQNINPSRTLQHDLRGQSMIASKARTTS